MADIFVSYTSINQDWAFWIGQELKELGHTPRIHEWEIPAGGDIPAWMEERLEKADRVLCVISANYLTKDYSGWERRSAQWAAASNRANFMLPVFVEDCEAPVAMAHIKRCPLFGLRPLPVFKLVLIRARRPRQSSRCRRSLENNAVPHARGYWLPALGLKGKSSMRSLNKPASRLAHR